MTKAAAKQVFQQALQLSNAGRLAEAQKLLQPVVKDPKALTETLQLLWRDHK